MEILSYNVGELRRLLRESSEAYKKTGEFKPVIGANVETDNKKNADKSYKDSKKRAKDYDGGLKDNPKRSDLPQRMDSNKGLIDYNPVTEPSKEYKERVGAQIEGYTSKMEKDNKSEKNASFDGNEKIRKQMEDARDKSNKEMEDIERSGLVGRTLSKDNFKKNTLSENKKMAKKLTFKHTRFLNESHMLSKIPEEYKVDGQKIYTKDGYGNEYIVECEQNSMGVVETNIVGYQNKDLVNEQVDRMFELMHYDTFKNKDERNFHTNLNENSAFSNLMDKVRNNKDVIK